MVEALDNYDEDGLIFQTLEEIINRTLFGDPIFGDTLDHFSSEIILEEFSPKLRLDHNLPVRLELIPIEKDVFYLLHIACYLTLQWERPKIQLGIEQIMIESIVKKRSKKEAGQLMKEHVCHYLKYQKNLNCISLENTTTWMNCQSSESIPQHQEWCNDCKNLSDCLGDKTHVYSLLKFNLKIFHS